MMEAQTLLLFRCLSSSFHFSHTIRLCCWHESHSFVLFLPRSEVSVSICQNVRAVIHPLNKNIFESYCINKFLLIHSLPIRRFVSKQAKFWNFARCLIVWCLLIFSSILMFDIFRSFPPPTRWDPRLLGNLQSGNIVKQIKIGLISWKLQSSYWLDNILFYSRISWIRFFCVVSLLHISLNNCSLNALRWLPDFREEWKSI